MRGGGGQRPFGTFPKIHPFWYSRPSLTREGNFMRNGFHEVDEAEIFKGADNRLTMNQTYTKEFQCEYQLQRYPFDTQAI